MEKLLLLLCCKLAKLDVPAQEDGKDSCEVKKVVCFTPLPVVQLTTFAGIAQHSKVALNDHIMHHPFTLVNTW